MAQRSRIVQYLVTLSVSLALVTLGVLSAWSTPVLTKLSSNKTRVDINKDEISWMLGMNPLGFIAGSFATRFISDSLGRRVTILGSAAPITFGTIIVAFAMKAWLLYITLFMWGFGTGMVSSVVGIYVAEIADQEIRGKLSVCTKFMFNFGNLLVMVIGSYISYETLNYCILPLPFCYFAACWWIPESPYYYLKENKVDEARKVLMKLRGHSNAQAIEDELASKLADVKNEMSRSSSVGELFTGIQYRKAIIISAGIKLAQIMTGGVAIKQYLGIIMSKINIPTDYNGTAFIIFGVVTFITGIMSSVLVDRVGRRPLLIYSYFGTGVSLAVLGLYFFLQDVVRIDHNSLTAYKFISFIAIILSNVISTLGFNSLGAVVPAEIFPLNVKALAMTSLSIFGGVLGFAVAKGYQNFENWFGMTTVIWIFAGFGLAGGVFSYFLVPETKGKNLREIQVLMQGGVYDEAHEKLNPVVTGANKTFGDSKIKEIELNDTNDTRL